MENNCRDRCYISGIIVNSEMAKKLKIQNVSFNKHLVELRKGNVFLDQEEKDSNTTGYRRVRIREEVLREIVRKAPQLKKFISERKIDFSY